MNYFNSQLEGTDHISYVTFQECHLAYRTTRALPADHRSKTQQKIENAELIRLAGMKKQVTELRFLSHANSNLQRTERQ